MDQTDFCNQISMWFLLNIAPYIYKKFGDWIIMKLNLPNLNVGKPLIVSRPIISSISQPFKQNNQSYGGDPGTIHFDQLNATKESVNNKTNIEAKKYYIHVPIKNIQKSTVDISKAKNVYVLISYLSLENIPLIKGKKINGRWETADQPKRFQNKEELRYKDIQPESEQNLDVAMKSYRENTWYVVSNDNHINNISGQELGKNGFIFKLEINGDNVRKKEFSFKFENNVFEKLHEK